MGNICSCVGEDTTRSVQMQSLVLREELPDVAQSTSEEPSASEEPYESVPFQLSTMQPYYTIDRMRQVSGYLMDEDEAKEAIDFYTRNGRFSTKLFLYKSIALALRNYRSSEASRMPPRALDQLMFDTIINGLEYKMPPEVAWAIVNYNNENGQLPDWSSAARLLYLKKRPSVQFGPSVRSTTTSQEDYGYSQDTVPTSAQGETADDVDLDRLSPLADFSHIPTGKGRAKGSRRRLPYYYLKKARKRSK